MRNRSPALIFDFGNVVAHFDYRRACQALGRRSGLSGDALLERVKARGFSSVIQKYESGGMTAEAFSETVCQLADLEIPHADFAACWADIFWLNEPVARLIDSLKRRGYTLVLGSNTNDLHAAQFRRQFAETLAHFDRLVLSFEIGHIKPSASFFHACAEAAGSPPSSCVFIDDLPENVDGARAAGMTGLVYRDPLTLQAELGRLGVEIPGN